MFATTTCHLAVWLYVLALAKGGEVMVQELDRYDVSRRQGYLTIKGTMVFINSHTHKLHESCQVIKIMFIYYLIGCLMSRRNKYILMTRI